MASAWLASTRAVVFYDSDIDGLNAVRSETGHMQTALRFNVGLRVMD